MLAEELAEPAHQATTVKQFRTSVGVGQWDNRAKVILVNFTGVVRTVSVLIDLRFVELDPIERE